ncbi:C39 family peptidase [Methanoregula sp.]|uniref:C39 family peptidase n=1 Tax=Methanoregula sp. TaxID=2052170 RepID=UPI002621FA8F|nr:C39 family peptidase [Methanoregula sp.]MDD5143299.1 C39 family peptidase [Methanoregula sp.]
MKRPDPILFIGLFFVAGGILLAATLSATGEDSRDTGRITYGLDSRLPLPQYYTGIDFDSLETNDHLTAIPLKSIRQQVTNYSCGAVAAMTVMSYYNKPVNNTDEGEVLLAHEMYPEVSEKTGINPEQMTAWFNRNGWNATWHTGGSRDMLLSNLKAGIPTIVEWIDWGGHWVVVVGYDTRGTETVWDDVIIFADSVDCHDDRVDGITYANYGQFDAMWFDAHYFPQGMQDRVYVVAVPA